MAHFRMIAVRDFRHNGIDYARGERFEVTAVHAAAITRARNARFLTPHDDDIPPPPVVEPKALVAEPVTTRAAKKTRAPRKPRTYKRRDMTAEHTT
jgi:hypothetical protein